MPPLQRVTGLNVLLGPTSPALQYRLAASFRRKGERMRATWSLPTP